jgi:signal transduction histidine kinase
LTHWEALTSPEFVEVTARQAAELAARGETAPYEKQMIRKDGSRWWGLFAPTRLAGTGTQTECVEFVVDTTELRDAQEERERALAEAERGREEAERAHASLQTFLGVVAHDLRAPLTSIRGNAEMLRRRGAAADADRQRRRLESIEEQSGRMNRMIGSLVDAARIGAGQLEVRPEPTDLVALVRRAVDAARTTTEQHRIELDAPERLEGSWDPNRLGQVLDNLLGNAAKYSPRGGEIRVRVTRQDDEAVVSVTDQGIGLRSEDLPRLFRLFSRLEGSGGIAGTGLGLYITYGIVKAHGGRAWAESPGPEKGATFAVALPLSAEGQPSAGARPGS